MSQWLQQAFSNLYLPAPVTERVIEEYGDGYADYLAENQSLGLVAVKLLTKKLSAGAAAALLRTPHYEVLDAVLSTRERRDTVLSAITNYWKLSAADQLRFVNRALSESIADVVLQAAYFTDEAKKIAAKRASKRVLAEWIVDCELSDDEVFEIVSAEIAKDRYALKEESVVLLISRPALRSRFANSGVSAMMLAACFVELDSVDDQRLCARAAFESSYIRAEALIAMMLQPSLDPGIRKEIWEHAHNDARSKSTLVAMLRANVATPSSAYPLPRKLADFTDSREVEQLISNLLAAGWLSYHERTAISGMLCGLATNPHLDQPTKLRLLTVLSACVEDSSSTPRSTMVPLIHCLAEEAIDDVQERSQYLRYLGRYQLDRVESALRTRANMLQATKELTASVAASSFSYEIPEPSYRADDDRLLSDTPAGMGRYWGHMSSRVAGYLIHQLGDGSSAQSLDSWSMFFDSVLRNPTASLAELTKTACNLARLSAPAAV